MPTNRQKMPWHLLFLLVGFLIGPGFILLSGHDRWDGVIGEYLIESNHLIGLDEWLLDSGWWLLYVLMRGASWLVLHAGFDYWITLKVVMAATVCWIAYEVFRLAKDLFRMDEIQSCWAAALVLMFPGYVSFHASCHVGVGLFVVFALLGYRLTLGPGVWRVVLGLILIGLSFQMNSNMVLVPALELSRLVIAGKFARRDVARMAFLLALSVAGYLFWRLVVGTGGEFSETGYNDIVWPTNLAAVKRLAIMTVLWTTWIPVLALGPASWFAFRMFQRSPATAISDESDQPLELARRRLFAGLLLCCAAVVAYIAAGKAAPFFGTTVFGTGGSVWVAFIMDFRPGAFFSGLSSPQIRHTILLGPMLSLTTVAACIYVGRRFPSARITPAAALSLMLGVACLHQAGWGLWAHHQKLVQSALDQSVLNALKKLPPPPDGASVLVERHQLQKDWMGTLQTNFMLYEAYGRTAWMANTVFAPSGPSYDNALSSIEDIKALFLRWAPKKGIRAFHIADDFTDTGCTARYVFDLAKPSVIDLFLRMPFSPATIAPATLVSSASQCPGR